jgi:predicted DNA-binding transcriptional regulator AlpA
MADALFLSPAEVAQVLGIPQSTLRFWHWSGAAPTDFPAPVKVGRLIRYHRPAIESWIESQIEAAQGGGPDAR